MTVICVSDTGNWSSEPSRFVLLYNIGLCVSSGAFQQEVRGSGGKVF